MPLSLCETGTLSPSSLTPHSASGLLIQLCDDLERGSHTTGLCNWPHHSARPPALRTLSGLPSFSRPGRRPCVARACGRVTLPMWTKYVAGSAHPCGPSTWPGQCSPVDQARGQVGVPVWTECVAGSASLCGLAVFARPFTQQHSLGGRPLSPPVTCASRNPGREHSRTRCFQSLRTFTQRGTVGLGAILPTDFHRRRTGPGPRKALGTPRSLEDRGQAPNPGAVLLLRTLTLPEIGNTDVTVSRQSQTRL